MSDKPEIELDLDLQLLPAWARQPQTANRYANFDDGGSGGNRDRDRDRRGGPRPRGPGGPGGPGGPRRDFRGGPRPDFRGPRPGGPGGQGGPGQGQGPGPGPGGPGGRPDRGGPGGPRRDDGRGGPRRGGDRGPGPGPGGDFRRREPVEEALPEGIQIDLIPDPAGVDSLTRQIRQTGRAYPLFDIAHLILKRPDRYHLEFRASGNNPDGTPRQFFVCNLDDTVWLSEGDAVRHILSRHFGTFYQTEKIAVEPPKGTYTFVAQCGMSGVILGPPNLHGYQTKLQKIHADRFSRMPFDVYKSRVKIVRDEAIVKQWIDEQSFKFEYTALNLPEPVKLPSREAVEQHFRQTHLGNIVQPHTTHSVRTAAGREALPPILRRFARREFDLQQRFPLKIVTRLSDDFAHRGLHFFKVNKTVLHVAVARPRYLDIETSPIGDGIKRIVTTIQATRDCTRRKLLEALGVSLAQPTPAPAAAAAPVEPAPEAPATEGAPASAETPAAASTDVTPAPAPTPAPLPVEAPPSPELQAIVTDLHWLIHEGHVIEFANGHLEVAKKPAPKPPQPPRPPKAPRAPKPETTEAGAADAAGTPEAAAVEMQPQAAAEEAGTPAAEATEATESAPAEAVEAPPAAETQDAAPTTPPAAPGDDESRINPS